MPILEVLDSHAKDLGGGLRIRRLLPAASHQSVGPFVFMDHFGPIVRQPEGCMAGQRMGQIPGETEFIPLPER